MKVIGYSEFLSAGRRDPLKDADWEPSFFVLPGYDAGPSHLAVLTPHTAWKLSEYDRLSSQARFIIADRGAFDPLSPEFFELLAKPVPTSPGRFLVVPAPHVVLIDRDTLQPSTRASVAGWETRSWNDLINPKF